MNADRPPEAKRLEELWSGQFGKEYLERNRAATDRRGPFWQTILDEFPVQSALEIGCNLGGNLRWLASRVPPRQLYGIDISTAALAELHRLLPEVNAIWSPARELPFRDRWFDLVFTMGVLIHQPEETLPLVMAEMVRCSRRYVLCGEYFAEQTTEVAYRGETGALFKRDYGGLFQRLFPELKLARQGFLSREQGWDDVTFWLFERP